MRKYFRITLAVIFAGLLLPTVISAQSDNKAEEPLMRRVKNRILTSTSLPAVRIKFDKAFKYVGAQRFVLYDRAQVEQHFFVEADKRRRIKRMYMVQFEGYLPGINATYDYPLTKTVKLGGQTYLVNSESIPDVPAALKQNLESDAAHAASFLESKGYVISESILFQRFVRLVDEAKRNEFILLYIESAAADASSDKTNAMQEFSGRALKGFTVLE